MAHGAGRIRALTALVALAVAAAGYWLYVSQGRLLREMVERDLAAVARLKVEQVAAFRAELLADGAVLGANAFVSAGATRWLRTGQPDDRQALLALFERVHSEYRYSDVLLVDAGGRVRLSLHRVGARLAPDHLEGLATALRTRRPLQLDLHIGEMHTAPRLGVVAPLISPGDSAPPTAALVLEIDPQTFLYPLIEQWPTPSRTAETLLVRRDGDDVLFLNSLRHRPGQPLAFRIPLTRTEVPAVKAVLGGVGVFHGPDYRGEPVISVVRRVPGSPWSMVAKIDEAEALAVWRFRSALLLLMTIGGVLLAGAGGLIVVQRREAGHVRALLAAETARAQSELRYETTLRGIGDGVIVTDGQGRVTLLNPVAEALCGWSDAEARGRPLAEVFNIVNETTRGQVEDPVAKVLRDGMVVNLANHTLLIARDGSERPIADSGAPVHDSEGAIAGVVLVFRDQSDERAAESALIASLEGARRRERQVSALARASRAVLDAPTFEAAAAAVLAACRAVTGSSAGVVTLLSAESGDDSLLVVSGEVPLGAQGQAASLPVRGLRAAAYAERAVVVENDFADSAWAGALPAGHMRLANALVAPLVPEGQPAGTLVLANKAGDYDDEDAAVVGSLAEVAAVALQRWRVQSELLAREASYRALVEALPDVVERHDAEGRHLYVSPNAQYLGIDTDQALGRTHQEMGIDPALCELLDVANDQVFATGCPYEGMFDVDTPEGRRLINLRLVPETDDSGQVGSLVGVLRDVTAHHQSDLAAHQMAEMLDAAPNAITVHDADGRWLYSNQRNARMHGYTVEEFMATRLSEIDTPATADLIASRMEQIARHGEAVFEVEHRRRDGSVFPLRVEVKQVTWDGQLAMLSIGTDIAERRLIERTQLFLIECGSPASGEDFFRALAAYLADALDACYVCIDQLVGDGLSARTVAVWHDGAFEDNVTYALADTPCGQVAQEGFCWFAQGVRHLFPNDEVLMDMGAESYAGCLLWGSGGQPIGLIAVIGREPNEQRSLAEAILRLVAVRAAAELERRGAEQALRDSEELLAQTGELSHVGGWSVDMATMALAWTPETYRLHEVDDDFEPTVDRAMAFYAPASRRRLHRAVARSRSDGRSFDLELDLITARGNRRQVHVVGRARWREGRVAEIVGALQDITSRKRTEEALRLRLELTSFEPGHTLDDLLRHTLDRVGAMVDSPIGFYHFVNDDQQSLTLQVWSTATERDFCRAEGHGLHYAVADAGVWADAIRTRGVIVHNDYAALAERRGLPVGHAEVVREVVVPILRDNRVVAVMGVGNKPADYSAEDVQAVAYLADMTWDLVERRRAELDRERLETQLIQAQKMEAVGRLAGGVAHDFNNMLGVILGHVELVMDQIPADHEAHADLTEVQAAAQRSADLTRQLLAFARRQAVEPRVLDINEHVKGSIKMLRRLIGEDIDLVFRPSEPLWSVRIDPAQLNQVVANLCVNGRDAIVGVGAITIETANVTIGAEGSPAPDGVSHGDYVQLAVSDTGCGMDSATLANVFEPFFTTKGVGEGTGLGLAMVYGVAKQNDGFIDVSSEVGRGTTFRLLLPRWLAGDDEGAAAPPTSTTEHPRGSGTVLLVEDEGAILRVSGRILSAAGYNVLAAGSPSEAIRLAHARDGAIDLLITDVIMPEMSGRELAELLVALNPELAVVFMSGYTADVIARHGVLESGVHFLQKPFTRADLVAKVREALDQTEPT